MSGSQFKASDQPFDWLGPGIYFWENDPVRALQWAQLPWRKIESPSVIGAAIDLGRCLDLTTQDGIEAVRSAYVGLKQLHQQTGERLPTNTGLEKGKRLLDCAVVKHLHRARAQVERTDATAQPYQSVRALFVEGKKLYSGAGFHRKTHVQICVCEQQQILGVFRLPGWQRSSLDFEGELY